MSTKSSMAKGNALAVEKRAQAQQAGSGSGTLWSNQEEMKRYVAKLKAELDEQKNRVKRVHRDKAEEIKRLQESLDNERQKAIENVAKKLESDKAYEMKKLRDAVVKQKESELRQALRLKDEELKALKQEVQEFKNNTRVLELENKRMLNERSRDDGNDAERRLKNEVTALRHEKRRLEESLRIKTETDSEKAEAIRKMKYEHDSEVQRLTRESKRESFKEFRHLKAVSKEIEVKNHQLAAKELEMRRLEEEKNLLGNKLNMQRKKLAPDGNSSKNDSAISQKPKGSSVSQESDIEIVAEDRIKKLKTRNSELVGIARKLEEKAKRLQEEKEILEKSSPLSPEIGSLKKAFARQRAKDLAEHAKLLMNKESEIGNLKKEVQQGSSNGFNHNDNVDELEKIVQQTAKERLLLEKQLCSKEDQDLAEEMEEIRSKNLKLTNDNEILKGELCKLQDIKAQHFKTIFKLKEIREQRDNLQHASTETDKSIHKLELETQTFVAKNDALQKTNDELSHKVDQLGKFEDECATLKENLQTLKNDHEILKAENSKLRAQIDSLFALKKELAKLQEENVDLQNDMEDSVFKLEEREKEISHLHQVQDEAQRRHEEQVSELDDMVRRLTDQSAGVQAPSDKGVVKPQDLPVLSSTPKNAKGTQTSRPSSPALSPIINDQSGNVPEAGELNNRPETNQGHLQDSLRVPDYATSSSTSFDLEKAAIRIEQLAATDSDDIDFRSKQRTDSPSVSSEISDDTEEEGSDDSTSEDTSYGADVSRTSDCEEPDQTKENKKDEVQNRDYEDGNDFIGNELYEVSNIEEKLSIFIAKYSYDPILYSPNDNPESELAFQAGDYLYVFGDVDDDGFFVGELMNGERGLVPSNFIERIAEEDEAILKESDERDDNDDSEDNSSEEEITLKDEDGKRKVIHPKAFSERRHESFRTSLDYMLNEQLEDIRESEEEDLGSSPENDFGGTKRGSKAAGQKSGDGLDSTDSDVPPPRVPSPTKVSVDRQFTNSALISWKGSTLPSDEVQGYNIYVNGKLKSQTKGNQKSDALVENINPEETYRLSVRTRSVNGGESPDHEATVMLGPDAKLSPYSLQVLQVTQTSAEIQWIPANSSYPHDVFLDDSLLFCVQPPVSSYTLNELSPSTLYWVRVRSQVLNYLKLPLDKAGTEDNLSSEIQFTTSAGGLPEPPVDLRLEQQTPEKITLTWLPVTISQNGHSNGFKVNGYKVYVNDIYCAETDSASVDSLSITTERLRNLGKRQDLTRMRFVVRTLSVLGESADSNIVEVGSTEPNDSTGSPSPEGRLQSEENEMRTDNGLGDSEKDTKVKGEQQRLNDSVLGTSTPASDGPPTGFSSETYSKNSISTLGPTLSFNTSSENEENNSFDKREKDNLDSEAHNPTTRDPTSEDGLDEQQSKPASIKDVGLCSATEEVGSEVTEQGTGRRDGPFEECDVVPPEGRRKPIVVHYDVDEEETESESCTVESKTETEEESVEIFVDPKMTEEGGGDVKKANDVALSTGNQDDKNTQSSPATVAGEEDSDSKTDSDFSEPLSVIDEVDEENLSETNSNSSPKRGQCETKHEEDSVSKTQQKSALSSPSKTSHSSGSTGSSEEEGFRTDDDVLDLLDDDDDNGFDEKPVEKHVETLRLTQNNTVPACEQLTSLSNDENTDDKQSNLSFDQSEESRTKESDTLGNDEALSNVENYEKSTDSNETLMDKLIVPTHTNENTTGEESTGNISDPSFPTGSSLNSDSSSALSDEPFPTDDVPKTLSLPGNREHDESDTNDNLDLGAGLTGKPDLRSDDSRLQSETGEGDSELIRYFVALYNYDPSSMSPNSDGAEEELPFKEGDLIKVFDDKDEDGFFWGQCQRRQGYVPSNMVSEVAIDEAEDMFNETTHNTELVTEDLQMNGHSELDVDVVSEDYFSSDGTGVRTDRLAFWETLGNGDLRPRKMRALFDYNPVKDSPNVDSEVELMFKMGEIIYVFGDVGDDGFYQGELRGIRGLVPSNFLEPVKVTEFDTNDNLKPRKRSISPPKSPTSQRYAVSSRDLPNGTSKEEEQQKKKKGIFSKGKKMFKKAFR